MPKPVEQNLQRALEEKYGLTEILLVEGRFVALLGNTHHATSLVSLGIGMRCFVVALVNLAGDYMDYELLQLTPLSLLTFSCHHLSKRLKVNSPFKQTQVYQLCSSLNENDIWESFTSHIKYLYTGYPKHGWSKESLKHSGDQNASENYNKHQKTNNSDITPYRPMLSSIQLLYSNQKAKDDKRLHRAKSLPCVMPSLKVNTTVFQKPICSNSTSEICSPKSTEKHTGRDLDVDLIRMNSLAMDKSNNRNTEDSDDDTKPDQGGQMDDTEAVTTEAEVILDLKNSYTASNSKLDIAGVVERIGSADNGNAAEKNMTAGEAATKEKKPSLFKRIFRCFTCCVKKTE